MVLCLDVSRVLWCFVPDTFHKPGFKLHARILHYLFSVIVEGSIIQAPLWDTQAKGPNAYATNAEYARDAVTELLCSSFPNMQKPQVEVCWSNVNRDVNCEGQL